VDILKVGQKMTLEHTLGLVRNMRGAIHIYSLKSGRAFQTKETVAGLQVLRVK
jgi:hypothetical protein